MEVIEGGAQSNFGNPVGREYGPVRAAWERVKREIWTYRLRRWIPRLVWLGDEVDVTITLTEDALRETGAPFSNLFSGGFYEIEKQLHNMGISFDTGCGCNGRDWEFDWSLRGPIRVKFRGRAKNPERRVREIKSKPKLVA
jgi:hypothetical protein